MEPDTTERQLMAERRRRGQEHTSKLLHMLRGGYGSALEAAMPPVAPATKIAEIPNVYLRSPAPKTSAPLTKIPAVPEIVSVAASLQHPSGKIGALMAGVEALGQARRIFNAYLREDLRQHALLVRLDSNAWVVQTEAAVWAVRLRYALFEIREALGVHCGFPLPKPRIQIVPNAAPVSNPIPQRRLAPAAGRALQELARHESDPQLQAALLRLASRV